MKAVSIAIATLVFAVNVTSTTAAEPVEAMTPRVHEPNPSRTFGQPNPNAPKELTQFAFLIGEYTCVDELTDTDGNTTRLDARWSGKYILNGYGIQDSYWNESFSTTNIRVYSEPESKWQVSYFREPKGQSGTWVGAAEDSDVVLRRSFEWNDQTVESRLTFTNITLTGFDWTSEYISDEIQYANWTSSCQRLH